MKKSISILISLLFGIVALFGVAGCNKELDEMQNDDSITYRVAYEGKSYDWSEERLNFIGLCGSLDELKALCKKNNFRPYDEGTTDYETNLGQKIREYKIGHFKSKSLAVCAFTEPFFMGELKVEMLVVDENTLTIKIKRHGSNNTADDVMVCWGFVIEADKSYVSTVTNLTYLVF